MKLTNIREIRFHLCHSSPSSNGLRNFINSNYETLKSSNPGLPVLVREAENCQARAFLRYPFGVEKSVNLHGMNETQVAEILKKAVTSPTEPLKIQ